MQQYYVTKLVVCCLEGTPVVETTLPGRLVNINSFPRQSGLSSVLSSAYIANNMDLNQTAPVPDQGS